MLIVWGTKANNYLSLYQISKIEKRAKENKQKTTSTWYQLAILAGKKMAGQVIGKSAVNQVSVEVLERYEGW